MTGPKMVRVTQADRDAAKGWSAHNNGTLESLTIALALHRQQAVAPLEAERAAVLQNKWVNDAIQTAFEKGELTLSSDGYLALVTEETGHE